LPRQTPRIAALTLAALTSATLAAQTTTYVEPEEAKPEAAAVAAGSADEPQPEVVSEPHASFDFGGRVQADYTFFSESEPFNGTFGTVENGGEFRRLRARANGHVGRIDYKAQLDFAGYEVNPKDLYVGLRGLPVTLRVGYQYEPWGLEQQTSSRYMTFMERSLAVSFSPARNLGVRVIKNYDDQAHWSVGVFRETDGWATTPGEHYNLTARATYAPILSADRRRLLHFGINYIHKFVDGDLTFSLRPDAHAAPSVVRLAVPATAADYVQGEVSGNIGSLGLQAEVVQGWIQSTVRNDPRVWSGYVQANFFLTGETRPYASSTFGRVKPMHSVFDGGTGAIELKARFAKADFAQATETGVGELVAFTTGLNWYLTSHLRVMAEFSRSDLPDANVDATSIWNFRFMTDF
jgi:phosphate-selective porin OprO/OprP